MPKKTTFIKILDFFVDKPCLVFEKELSSKNIIFAFISVCTCTSIHIYICIRLLFCSSPLCRLDYPQKEAIQFATSQRQWQSSFRKWPCCISPSLAQYIGCQNIFYFADKICNFCSVASFNWPRGVKSKLLFHHSFSFSLSLSLSLTSVFLTLPTTAIKINIRWKRRFAILHLQ